MDDIELTAAALEACGYRVHLRERAGTRWVTAAKGLQVKYTHWHPLTNINQAMQLLQDADLEIHVAVSSPDDTAQSLINAQCRSIVTACASLKGTL